MLSLTQLVGTTATNSPTLYPMSFTTLTTNNSPANVAQGAALVSQQHRQLLQKYFDNERTYTTTTIGGTILTLTGTLSASAVSATLSSSWTYATVKQLVTFSNSDQRMVQFSNGSTAITWSLGLSSTATATIATVGVQAYPIPANVSKVVNDTINVGQLKYVPAPVMSRADWDRINYLPYTSDIPNYFYIYNGNVEFFPIPSTTGNIITFNYKTRVPDLNFADYSTGTITSTAGGYTVAGITTSWNTTGNFPLNTDLSFFNLMIAATPPKGDGIWYPITKFTSDTALTLSLPVVNAPGTGASYVIGQFPLLNEDFHDMLVYGALKTYFSSIVKDTDKFKQYEKMYDDRLELLEQYAGTKQVNVDLGQTPNMVNPNLFIYKSS